LPCWAQQRICVWPYLSFYHSRRDLLLSSLEGVGGGSRPRNRYHFDLGWVRIANPETAITPNQIVAVEAHTLGLWSLNCNRILSVIDEDIPGKPRRFGYAYGTTHLHVESGEERFLLEQDLAGNVFYELLAISRSRHWLARLSYPYTRSQQRRFARDSHARMAQLAAASIPATSPALPADSGSPSAGCLQARRESEYRAPGRSS